MTRTQVLLVLVLVYTFVCCYCPSPLDFLFSLQLEVQKLPLDIPPEKFLTPVYILLISSFFELILYSIHHVTTSLFFKRKRLGCCQSIGLRSIWSMFLTTQLQFWYWYTCFFLGVAELLIFHPVDTVAKRLMSNKAKVCTICSYDLELNSSVKSRFLSQHCHPLSSETLLQLLLHENSYHYSLVLDMLLDTRLHNECTSSVVNRGLTTSSTSTTRIVLLILLASGKGRWWCKHQLEGRYIHFYPLSYQGITGFSIF